jgi:hypothetical protein
MVFSVLRKQDRLAFHYQAIRFYLLYAIIKNKSGDSTPGTSTTYFKKTFNIQILADKLLCQSSIRLA